MFARGKTFLGATFDFIVSINTQGPSLIHWFQMTSPQEKKAWMGVFNLTIINISTGTYCTYPVLFLANKLYGLF